MEFNSEQIDIFEATEKTVRNIVVEARAGTGKTTTAVEGSMYIDPNMKVIYLAYNNSTVDTLTGRLPSNVPARTTHSIGLRNIMYHDNTTKIENEKCRIIFRKLYGHNADLEGPVLDLVSLCKTTDTAEPDLDYLMDRFDIIVESKYIDTVKEMASAVLFQSIANRKMIDFDDMLYLPAIGLIPLYKYDFVWVDEGQDQNPAQIAFIKRLIRYDGRIGVIGDRFQSIYAYRGADINAIPRWIDELDALTLPLTICYRCGSKIIEKAQKIVPDIRSFPGAHEGEINSAWKNRIIENIASVEDPMIICRTNAPLVSMAMKIISNGTKAQVRGRAIGKSIMSLIRKVERKFHSYDLRNFLVNMRDYCSDEAVKLIAVNKIGSATNLLDQCDTVIAVSSGANTIQDLINRVNTIFQDEISGIPLSSIHRAKGTEAKTVYILRPDLLPHPMAKIPWQREQERNLEYVAITRAKNTLTYVME